MYNLSDNDNIIILELIQEEDCIDTFDNLGIKTFNFVLPFIVFELPNSKTIQKIKIDFFDREAFEHKSIKYRPIELFSVNFWNQIEELGMEDTGGEDLPYEELIKHSICYLVSPAFEGLKNKGKDRRIFRLGDYLQIPFPMRCFNNVWKGYCLYQKHVYMDSHEFCLWFFRLNALFTDLIESPIDWNPNWLESYLLLLENIKLEKSQEFEYFVDDGWEEVRTNGIESEVDIYKLRINDAKKLLNDFNNTVEIKSSLEEFLKTFYDDFGALLCEKEYLKKCELCNLYFNDRKNKKYCSMKTDGRDCGTQARNKRNYSKNKSKIKKHSRKEMRETRAFYKNKGVQK